MKRGEIYWIDFDDSAGMRPAVILTRSAGLAFLNSVTVGPLTTTMRNSPTWVQVGLDDGLPDDSCINLDSIQTVRLDFVRGHVCELSAERMLEVDEAVRFALGLHRPPDA